MDKILVVTHKLFDDSDLPEGYQVIAVGSQLKNKSQKMGGWISDAENVDNIANENPYYCELTALYSLWKIQNQDLDIVGLVHYRRYFMDYHCCSKKFADDILTMEAARQYLTKYKIILPFMAAKYPNSSIMHRNKPFSEQDKHWQIIYQIIKEKYPDYMNAFEKVIYSKEQVWFNMYVAKKELSDQYCEWLFGVLKEYDNYIENVYKEERIPRVDGFLSELLILVWVRKNIKEEDIKYLDVKNTEANKRLNYNTNFANKVLHRLISNYYLLSCYEWLKAKISVMYRFHIARQQNN